MEDSSNSRVKKEGGLDPFQEEESKRAPGGRPKRIFRSFIAIHVNISIRFRVL